MHRLCPHLWLSRSIPFQSLPFPSSFSDLVLSKEAQFQPKLFSLMTGAEIPCSRTLRPFELCPLLRLPLLPPLPLLRPLEDAAVTAAEARPLALPLL